MKGNKFYSSLVIAWLILLLALPAAGKEVTAMGVGVAPIIKGDEDAARRVALQLAKRDAVERALGAEVEAEAIPAQELTRITATAAGRLQFRILHEGKDKGAYIIEIEAKVEVPPELEKKYPRSVAEEITGYKPLIQKFPGAELNWEEGYVIATGAAKLKGDSPKAQAEASRAARLDAYQVALKAVSGIPLDPELTVQQRIQQAPALEYKLMGLVRGAEVLEEGPSGPGVYEVTIKVPLRGIRGVQTAFTETKKPGSGIPPGARKEEPPAGAYTGIIVDARGLSAMPALFPEIVDEEGEPLYTVEMVDPAALARRGMAAYVTGEKSEPGKKGAFLEPGRFLVIPAKAVSLTGPGVEPYNPGAIRLDQSPGPFRGFKFSARPAFLASVSMSPVQGWIPSLRALRPLAQAQPRVVFRQGRTPVRVRPVKSQGPTRARIVVKRQDALQVRKARGQYDFFRTARVVIITDSMIGGTEGRRWPFRRALIPAR